MSAGLVRRLVVADAAAYRALRLRALREEPDAFLVAPEEEEATTLAELEARFKGDWSSPDDGVLGAVVDGTLVGTVGFFREALVRTRHRAVIWGMYVAPEARGRGLGRALLERALEALAAAGGIEQVHLTATTTNAPALGLYRSAGFVSEGISLRAMKLGERYVDEELLVLRLR